MQMKPLALLSALLLSGCAVSPVQLSADTAGGAQCTLVNDRGTWTATTPALVYVKQSPSPLVIACKSATGLAVMTLLGPDYKIRTTTIPFERVK